MNRYEVYIHKNFSMTFKLKNGAATCIRGSVFDDMFNPIAYNTEQEAVDVVKAAADEPVFERSGDLIRMSFTAVQAHRIVEGRISPDVIFSNIPEIDDIEAYVAKSFA